MGYRFGNVFGPESKIALSVQRTYSYVWVGMNH